MRATVILAAVTVNTLVQRYYSGAGGGTAGQRTLQCRGPMTVVTHVQ